MKMDRRKLRYVLLVTSCFLLGASLAVTAALAQQPPGASTQDLMRSVETELVRGGLPPPAQFRGFSVDIRLKTPAWSLVLLGWPPPCHGGNQPESFSGGTAILPCGGIGRRSLTVSGAVIREGYRIVD